MYIHIHTLSFLLCTGERRPKESFLALACTVMRRTRSTEKCILGGLASGGINSRESNCTTIMFPTEDWVHFTGPG